MEQLPSDRPYRNVGPTSQRSLYREVPEEEAPFVKETFDVILKEYIKAFVTNNDPMLDALGQPSFKGIIDEEPLTEAPDDLADGIKKLPYRWFTRRPGTNKVETEEEKKAKTELAVIINRKRLAVYNDLMNGRVAMHKETDLRKAARIDGRTSQWLQVYRRITQKMVDDVYIDAVATSDDDLITALRKGGKLEELAAMDWSLIRVIVTEELDGSDVAEDILKYEGMDEDEISETDIWEIIARRFRTAEALRRGSAYEAMELTADEAIVWTAGKAMEYFDNIDRAKAVEAYDDPFTPIIVKRVLQIMIEESHYVVKANPDIYEKINRRLHDAIAEGDPVVSALLQDFQIPDPSGVDIVSSADVNALIDNETALMQAVRYKNSSAIEALMEHHDIDPNIQNAEGETVLHVAVVFNNSMLQVLFNNDMYKREERSKEGRKYQGRFDVSIRTSYIDLEHRTPLEVAKSFVREYDEGENLTPRLKDISLLIEYATHKLHAAMLFAPFYEINKALDGGADVTMMIDGKNALHVAVEKCYFVGTQSLTRILSTSSVNAQDGNGMTAMHLLMLTTGLRESVPRFIADAMDTLLSRADIRLNIQDDAGNTVLHYAVVNNELLERLCEEEYIDLRIRNIAGSTAFESADDTGKALLQRYQDTQNEKLLDSLDDLGFTILTLKYLKTGADPNATDDDGYNALHLLANSDDGEYNALHLDAQSLETFRNRRLEIADKILAGIHDVNAGTDGLKMTALMIAVQKNNINMVSKLLTVQAVDINLQDVNGYTALHYAVESKYDKSFEITRTLLMDDRIDVNVRTSKNFFGTPLTAYELAMSRKRSDIAGLIQEYKKRREFKTTTERGRKKRGEPSDLKKKPASTEPRGKRGRELHEKFNKLRF
jgi:ankyrin repeat protein